MTHNFESGIYYDHASAETTVRRLREMGYSDKDISVMMKDKDRARAFAEKTGTHAAEGAVTGGAIGGGLGAIMAGLMATGSVIAIAGAAKRFFARRIVNALRCYDGSSTGSRASSVNAGCASATLALRGMM